MGTNGKPYSEKGSLEGTRSSSDDDADNNGTLDDDNPGVLTFEEGKLHCPFTSMYANLNLQTLLGEWVAISAYSVVRCSLSGASSEPAYFPHHPPFSPLFPL